MPHSSQPQPPYQGTDQSSPARAGRSVIAVSRRSQSRASSSRGVLGPGPAAARELKMAVILSWIREEAPRMTAEHVQGDEPLIPMPALTLDALRQAVAA
ncbi:MAG: hypothetical protein ACLP5E_13495, partial [Streptosporangiaceae bacterium]